MDEGLIEVVKNLEELKRKKDSLFHKMIDYCKTGDIESIESIKPMMEEHHDIANKYYFELYKQPSKTLKDIKYLLEN